MADQADPYYLVTLDQLVQFSMDTAAAPACPCGGPRCMAIIPTGAGPDDYDIQPVQRHLGECPAVRDPATRTEFAAIVAGLIADAQTPGGGR